MIWIGSDHAGFELKKIVTQYLATQGIEYEDIGTKNNEPVDYPPIARQVAQAVSVDPTDRGILICKSGQGMAMTANRIKNVRASVVWSKDVARETREDNDSNILSLPSGYLTPDEAKEIVDVWLETSASTAIRHQRRIKEIDQL